MKRHGWQALLATTALALMTAGGLAQAQDPELTLVIRNHRFEPAEVKVPAGKKVKLIIDNQDATAEEFESHALNREKVIAGNIIIRQHGTKFHPGQGAGIGRDYTIYAGIDGFVKFETRGGRKLISVYPQE